MQIQASNSRHAGMLRGICIRVQGNCNSDPNQRSVTVMITDGCPQCEADHIDIQALTFEKVPPISQMQTAPVC